MIGFIDVSLSLNRCIFGLGSMGGSNNAEVVVDDPILSYNRLLIRILCGKVDMRPILVNASSCCDDISMMRTMIVIIRTLDLFVLTAKVLNLLSIVYNDSNEIFSQFCVLKTKENRLRWWRMTECK